MFETLPTQLFITISGNALSGVVMLLGGLFVLIQNPLKRANQLFFFLTFTTLLYTIFFIGAALQTDYVQAYRWWFLNICDVFITMAVVHLVFHIIKRDLEWRWFIALTYFVGCIIFITACINPHWFLPTVVTKLYFPYYLEAGWLYAVMLFYFLVFPLVAFVSLLYEYWFSTGIIKKRYEYFVIMLAVGYVIGCINFLLVFNVPVDPVFGMFLGLYLIPIAYGIFSSNLLDIRIVVRRALFYAVGIGGIAAFLTVIILLNEYLVASVPWLQFWTVPLAASVVAVLASRMVWGQVKETDRLKYEFITIAAHKLRTPLTRIRWEIPGLLERVGDSKEAREAVLRIDVANNRLIELTNILLESAHTEDTAYQYRKETIDLSLATKNALSRFDDQIREKGHTVTVQVEPGVVWPVGDPGRVASVVDVLIENAVIYTPKGGSIAVSIGPWHRSVRFAVSDTGIGINQEDRERMFLSFYRTDLAKTTDTEGVGIGLSVAKSIIEKHNGSIGVQSEGEGKGSTFWFTLPL